MDDQRSRESAAAADHSGVLRLHGFHALRVKSIVQETADTRTFLLAVPDDLRDVYVYRAGQYCNVRAIVAGDEVLRCYSMSSAPAVDEDLAITVKRVPGGVMSNWLLDHVAVGDSLELMKPAGVFVERDGDVPLLGYCGGSGVTPVFSLAKQVLATTDRSVRVLCANRDQDSIIFDAAWNALLTQYADRLDLQHHLDVSAGFLSAADIAAHAAGGPPADVYICGPAPFMDIVEAGLTQAGVAPDRISIERFANGAAPAAEAPVVGTPAVDGPAADGDSATESIAIVLKGKRHEFAYVKGDTVLDAARRGGLKPPFSCELGNCASCMALLSEGSARMRVNSALTPAEVEEGWVLTCQALPSGRRVVVTYENL